MKRSTNRSDSAQPADAAGAVDSDDPDPPQSARQGRRPGGGGGAGCAQQGKLELRWRTLTPPGRLKRPRWVRGRLLAVCHALGVTEGQLSVVVVDDEQMKGLHEQYRGEATTTDVLSFDLGEDPPGAAGSGAGKPSRIDGELVLCLDEASRQAESRGHDAEVELLLYAVHGLLHLLGEDDAEPEQARRMHQWEDELLSEVGVGPVYDGGGDRGGGRARRRRAGR